jgi:hypothetical protein
MSALTVAQDKAVEYFPDADENQNERPITENNTPRIKARTHIRHEKDHSERDQYQRSRDRTGTPSSGGIVHCVPL